jgi:hypothetical protein
MAKEESVYEVIRNVGYEPISDRCIVVTYAYKNLSDKIAKFFANEFYALQMCKNEIVLVPFSKLTMDLEEAAALAIPYDSIQSVEVSEDGLNYRITIMTDTDEIVLSAQQKELSNFRNSASFAGYTHNWHKENLDDTLKALVNLKG